MIKLMRKKKTWVILKKRTIIFNKLENGCSINQAELLYNPRDLKNIIKNSNPIILGNEWYYHRKF